MPTLAQLMRAHSQQAVINEAAYIVERGMELFDAKRRMTGEHVALFAEQIADDFPHESLADLNVFMRGAAMSKYDGGEYYSSVDLPRLTSWWRKYLAEKADTIEEAATREGHLEEQRSRDMVANIPGLGVAVRAFTMEARERRIAEEKAVRMNRLKEQLPKMVDQELRDLWPVYPSADERSLIIAEAERRGLVQRALAKAAE